MIAAIHRNGLTFTTDLNKPTDISIAIGDVRCYYAPPVNAVPVEIGDFIGSVKMGSSVNYYQMTSCPHGQGTHTECIGHITEQNQSINQVITEFHFVGMLVSTSLTKLSNGDLLVTKQDIEKSFLKKPIDVDACIIRTIPNAKEKIGKDYSGTNPPYLDVEVVKLLKAHGIRHLLVDLPSVDKEVDGGALVCHRTFWDSEHNQDSKSTITELVYVPESVIDGLYLINLQVSPLEMDAAPSRPLLYPLIRAN
jgi:kynurenine formamidase